MAEAETYSTVVPPQDDHLVNGKQISVRLGPYRDKVLVLPIAEADQAIADGWAEEHPGTLFDPNAPLPPPPTQAEQEAALAAANAWAQSATGNNPVITIIAPNTAAVGDPDVTLVVTGSGFNADSAIVFNNGAEPTTFEDATRLTTIVRPSTASGPADVPVVVRNGPVTSNERTFSFTTPVGEVTRNEKVAVASETERTARATEETGKSRRPRL
jgi:hypothetical protein